MWSTRGTEILRNGWSIPGSQFYSKAENSLINLIREGYWPAVKYLLEARRTAEEDKRWSAAESKSQDFEGAKRTLGSMVEVIEEHMPVHAGEKMREMELSCAGEYAAALEQNRNLFTNLPPMHLKDIDRSARCKSLKKRPKIRPEGVYTFRCIKFNVD